MPREFDVWCSNFFGIYFVRQLCSARASNKKVILTRVTSSCTFLINRLRIFRTVVFFLYSSFLVRMLRKDFGVVVVNFVYTVHRRWALVRFFKLENSIFEQAVDMAAFLALFIILTPIKNIIRTIITSVAKKLLPTTRLRVKIISEVHVNNAPSYRLCFAILFSSSRLIINISRSSLVCTQYTYYCYIFVIILFLLPKTNSKWKKYRAFFFFFLI